MDVASEIAPFPGAASVRTIAGGIASGLWLSGNSDASLLYRYTSRLLEIRSMVMPALEGPEALATLDTAQLQMNTVEDLEISLVKPVILNNTTYMLVYAYDTLSEVGRLYVFHPFTLTVFSVSAAVPYKASSLSVSTPLRAGSGSTTEWEFTILCFGLTNGKALIGNLSVNSDGAQLTDLDSFSLKAGKRKVSSSYTLELPDSTSRALIFLGLESGEISTIEYSPFGISRGHVISTISDSAHLGSVVCLTAAVLDENRFVLCAGHSIANAQSSGSAVSAYTVEIGSSNRPSVKLSCNHISTDYVHIIPSDDYDGQQQQQIIDSINSNAIFIDLAIYDMRSSLSAAKDGPTGTSGLVIAALAASSVDEDKGVSGFRGSASKASSIIKDRVRASGHRSAGAFGFGVTHGLFNAWDLGDDYSRLLPVSSQSILGSGVILGMSISGKASQVEVVSDRRLFVGDSLGKSMQDAGVGVQPGVSMLQYLSKCIDKANKFAYSPHVRHALSEQRRRMDGELFIDLLLRMAGISEAGRSSDSAYPPRTQAEQHRFIERVGSSDLDDLKQHCIGYYLILDQSSEALVSSNDVYVEGNTDLSTENEMAASYVRETLIPRHFEYLMRGYWLMDHGQTAASIAYLSDPSVIADWAPKVLSSAVANNCFRIGMQFLNSTTALMSPKLETQPSEAPLVMEVLLHCSISRAFDFQRQQCFSSDMRIALLAQLFSFAFSSHARRSIVGQLAVLPFDGIEEAGLEAYCLQADAPVHSRDFLALYYVNRGRYAEAIRTFKNISKAETGRNLDAAQIKKRDERTTMIQNLIMLLPEAQRWVVEEIEAISNESGGDSQSAQDVASSRGHAEKPSTNDTRGPWPVDADRASGAQQGATVNLNTATSTKSKAAFARLQPLAAPLSASKAARHIHAAVGANGTMQNASHPLIRLLVKQMSATKPVLEQAAEQSNHTGSFAIARSQPGKESTASGNSFARASHEPSTPKSQSATVLGNSGTPQNTLWKTPMSSFPDRTQSTTPLSHSRVSSALRTRGTLHVPFSGPPSTPCQSKANTKTVGLHHNAAIPSNPFSLEDAGQTPCKAVVGNAVVVETPLAIKNLPGGFPALNEVSRSPFEKAQARSVTREQQLVATAPVVSLQKHLHSYPEATTNNEYEYTMPESSTQKIYDLRNSTDLSTSTLPPSNDQMLGGRSRKQKKSRKDTIKQTSENTSSIKKSISVASKKSARNYERAMRQQSSDIAENGRLPKGRKRS
ncbi:hypothetical protein GGI26_004557 [Coemansia sp. RSA 1358]|nr:hypothetical protein GGI26_004557 [Coemansia sp. RSA 1358]